jgi:MFS family permease
MILGAVLITTVHVLFAAPFVNQWWMAVILMIVLGIGFSLVPSAMWPSLAKIMPEKQYGTAIALTFFVQNIGLWGVPFLIGWVLDKYCVIGTRVIDSLTVSSYDYTLPMTLFAIVCGSSIIVALSLKRLDKKKNYGIQEANIKKS